VQVFLLSRAGILKPHLGDPIAEPGDLRNTLQVLAVRVRVQLEIRLQHLQLFLGERGAHAFRFVLAVVALRISAF